MSSVVFWVVLLVMLIGLFGTVLPVIPGTPIIFTAALVFAFYENFAHVTILVLAILFILMILTLFIDYLAGVVGAKKFGASKLGTLGSFIGGILGIIFLNIPGLILGPFVGAVIGELIHGRQVTDALRAGLGAIIGFAGGAIFKLAIALGMIVVFITASL